MSLWTRYWSSPKFLAWLKTSALNCSALPDIVRYSPICASNSRGTLFPLPKYAILSELSGPLSLGLPSETTIIKTFAMCTSPITIKRFYPSIGERSYVVPCGKCEECTRKKQAEFGALALHQGLTSGSVYFVTFTYRNSMCPLAVSEDSKDGPHIIGFERGCDNWMSKDGVFVNARHCIKQKGKTPYFLTPSLCREDMKLCIKQFRTDWKKSYPDIPIELKYAVFGEVGEQHGRPHYHGLFFGLSAAQIKMLIDIWVARFGFTYTIPPNLNRNLSLEEIKKVSAYTSKYISKGIYTRWAHLLPYMEKPRRQSSINFGGFSEAELSQMCDFTFAAICLNPVPEFLPLASWTASYLDGKVSQLLSKNFQFLNA